MMPVPTSRPRDTMLNVADAGPPVSGNTEAVGVAVALAEGRGEPPSDGKGVKGPPVVLAIGYAQDRPSSFFVRKKSLRAWGYAGCCIRTS